MFGGQSPSPPSRHRGAVMRRRPRGARRLSVRRADRPHCGQSASSSSSRRSGICGCHSPGTGRITAPGSSWPQSTRIVQLKRRPTSNVDSMMVLRARRGGTGSKYVTLRGGVRRAIPFLLVRSGGCARSSILCGQGTLPPPSRRLHRTGDLYVIIRCVTMIRELSACCHQDRSRRKQAQRACLPYALKVRADEQFHKSGFRRLAVHPYSGSTLCESVLRPIGRSRF